jgi:hypothetical protein
MTGVPSNDYRESPLQGAEHYKLTERYVRYIEVLRAAHSEGLFIEECEA